MNYRLYINVKTSAETLTDTLLRCVKPVRLCLPAMESSPAKRRPFPASSPAPSSQDLLPSQMEMAKARQSANQTGISRPTLSYQAPGSSATSHGLPSLPLYITDPATSCYGAAASPSQTRPEVITGNSAGENQTFMDVILFQNIMLSRASPFEPIAEGLAGYA